MEGPSLKTEPWFYCIFISSAKLWVRNVSHFIKNHWKLEKVPLIKKMAFKKNSNQFKRERFHVEQFKSFLSLIVSLVVKIDIITIQFIWSVRISLLALALSLSRQDICALNENFFPSSSTEQLLCKRNECWNGKLLSRNRRHSSGSNRNNYSKLWENIQREYNLYGIHWNR